MQRQTNIKGEKGVFNVPRISPTGKEREKMIIGWRFSKREVIEEVGVIVGLVAVQFIYAGNSILLSHLLKLGIPPSSLIIISTFSTFLVLSPLAVVFERRQWPSRISCRLFFQLLLLSFGGVTVFQSLFMKGVNLTSPALATAMPNLAPGLIFFIACALRLEKLQFGCKYSRAKIAGTLLCVFGAVIMSLMQSASKIPLTKEFGISIPYRESDNEFNDQTIIGCMYLMAAVFVMSTQVVLQAITLRDFSASITLCAITSLLGAVITAIVEMVEEKDGSDPGWPSLSVREMVAYSIVAGSMSGMCVSFNAWAMKKRGPVMVSIFNPLGTVISAVSSIFLGESIAVGSVAGMCVMFTGLYLVLWAKRKEVTECVSDDDESSSQEADYDIEKPLLS